MTSGKPPGARQRSALRRAFLPKILSMLLAVLPATRAHADDAVTLMVASDAQPAAALLDSMGVNTHFTFDQSPYVTRYLDVRRKLIALGLHHIRDLLHPHVLDLGRAGITTTVLAEPDQGTAEAIRDRVKALNMAGRFVDAVEGANEPDMFWARLHITADGLGYPKGPVIWQQQLFAAFKHDDRTREITVIGPALGLAGMANAIPPPSWAGLRAYVDWGNFHPYPYNGNPFGPPLAYGDLKSFYKEGTFPSVYIGEAPDALRAYRTIYGPGPMAATETGYPAGSHFTSEADQAKYIPRLFAECFRLGLKRTYLYQLLDDFDDPTGRNADGSFGLLRFDMSERPSYAALAALAHLLAPRNATRQAPAVNLRLTLRVHGIGKFWDAGRVHHLLLQRGDGTLLLLLWDEVSAEDASTTPRRQIDVPALPATLETNVPTGFTVNGSQQKRSSKISFAVPDQLLAIEITR